MPDPSESIPPAASGGQGEVLTDPHHIRADVAMTARALRDPRFGISRERKDRLIGRLFEIVDTSEDLRAVVGAGKGILAAEAMNQTDEHLADKNARMDAGKPTDTPLTTLRVIVPGMKNEE